MHGSKTILLVEDEALIALATSRTLEKNGYHVLTAYTGAEAIRAVAEHPSVDLILMDINLGEGIDGTQAAQQILEIRELPLVFHSSHTEPEVVEKTESITSYGYVVKNSGETVLCASLKMAFKLFEAKIREREKDGALQTSEGQYKTTINAMEDYVHVIDPDFRIVLFNKSFHDRAREVGTKQNPVGDHLFSVFPFLSEKVRSEYLQVFKTGEPLITEELITIGGRETWAETRKFPIADEEGNTVQVITIIRDITEKKLASEALQIERDRLKQYLEIAGVMFIAIDSEGIITLINRKGCEILGYSHEEIIGKNWFDNFLPESIRTDVRSVFIGLMTGEIEAFEINENPVLTRDKTERMIRWHNTILKDENNKIIGSLSSGEDITEQEQVKLRLNENETKFRSIFENINVAAALHEIITDETGKPIDFVFLDANSMYEKLTKLKPSDIIGKKGSEVIPNLEQKWIEAYGRVAQTGEPATIIDHSEYLDSYWEVKVFSPQKNRFAVALTDITERKKTADALESSNSLMKTLLDNLQVGVFMVKAPTGEPLIVNKKAEELLGHSIDSDATTETLADVYRAYKLSTGALYPADEMPIVRAMKNESCHIDDMYILRPDGRRVMLEVFGTPVSDSQGNVVAGLASFSDITKRKEFEYEISALLEEKEILLKEVHHRIKNNIASIESLLSLQSDSITNPEAVTVLQDAIKRIMAIRVMYEKLLITEDYRDFSIKEYLDALINSIMGVPEHSFIKTIRQLDDFLINSKLLFPIGIIANELLTNIVKHAFPDREEALYKLL